MTTDTQRWIATTSDGQEVAIEVRREGDLYQAWIAWSGDELRHVQTSNGPNGAFVGAIAALRERVASAGTYIVEVRREGEPSRQQLLAAVAAARGLSNTCLVYYDEARDVVVCAACGAEGGDCEPEHEECPAVSLKTILAALPVTT